WTLGRSMSLRHLVWTLVRSELGESDEQQLHQTFLQIFQQLSSSGRGTVLRAEDLIVQHLQGLGRQRGQDRHLRFQSLRTRLHHPAARSVLALLFHLRADGGDTDRIPFLDPFQLQDAAEVKSRSNLRGEVKVSGWQLGARPPKEMPEAKLVRDLLFALQGVSSDCFDSNCEIDPAVVLTRPTWFLCQRILELAKLHLRLSNDAKDTASSCRMRQALCEALRKQLQGYYEVLAQLMSSEGLTLRHLWAQLLAPQSRLRFLSQLCEGSRGVFGCAIASMVWAFGASGDQVAQHLAKEILRSVVKPLWSMIRAWMTEGELQDPYGEFFVVADASVPLEDLWNRMYSLELEMVPSFISLELARKILLTGKSVNFIRLCCPGRSWSPSGADVPIAEEEEIGAFDLASRVERAALQNNEHLVKLMMDHYALGEHALALRRFLLLGQGDFVESLMDALHEELDLEASKLHKHQLMGILEMALRQSNAQFCSADVLGRLSVKLRSSERGDIGGVGWDVFLLDYAIDSPLHVVFTPAVMQKYDRAFSFLWKLRRVSHGLAASWNQHMVLQRHLVCSRDSLHWSPELKLEVKQTLHRCTCLRNEMHHFVQNVQAYVLEVLDTSWAKLQSGWQKSTDLDQVISQHDRYLACVEEGAFLARGSEAILSGVTTLLGLALEFCSLQEQACASSFEAAEAMQEAEDVASVFQAVRSRPFARSLAECRAQLDHLASTFTMKLQLFLRALEDQPERHSEISILSFLLCRLDFNAYYEQKNKRWAEGFEGGLTTDTGFMDGRRQFRKVRHRRHQAEPQARQSIWCCPQQHARKADGLAGVLSGPQGELIGKGLQLLAAKGVLPGLLGKGGAQPGLGAGKSPQGGLGFGGPPMPCPNAGATPLPAIAQRSGSNSFDPFLTEVQGFMERWDLETRFEPKLVGVQWTNAVSQHDTQSIPAGMA
ncbi:unnamed protein product, partial [Cladocopium goreaui]